MAIHAAAIRVPTNRSRSPSRSKSQRKAELPDSCKVRKDAFVADHRTSRSVIDVQRISQRHLIVWLLVTAADDVEVLVAIGIKIEEDCCHFADHHFVVPGARFGDKFAFSGLHKQFARLADGSSDITVGKRPSPSTSAQAIPEPKCESSFGNNG